MTASFFKAEKGNGKPSDGRVIVPRLIDVSKIEIKAPEWLWDNKFHYGGLSLIAGLPKQGKSMLTAYMAAVISQGRNWCDGSLANMVAFCFLPVRIVQRNTPGV